MKHFEKFIHLIETPLPPHTLVKNFCGTPLEKNSQAFKNSPAETDSQFQTSSQNITVEQFTITSISSTGISLLQTI